MLFEMQPFSRRVTYACFQLDYLFYLWQITKVLLHSGKLEREPGGLELLKILETENLQQIPKEKLNTL